MRAPRFIQQKWKEDFSLFTATQLTNLSKFCYDIAKLLVGGGVVAPLVQLMLSTSKQAECLAKQAEEIIARCTEFAYQMLIFSAILITVAFILDGIADRMGKNK